MKSSLVTCPMCGYQFDPAEHTACQGCPLQNGCQLVCCPACGYETVDTGQSVLARLATRLFERKKSEAHSENSSTESERNHL